MLRTPRIISKNRTLKITLTFIIVVMLISCAAMAISHFFTITDISVTGNEHYSDEEIIDFIASKPYERNSIVLFLKYNNKTIKNIPFIEQMDVSIVSPTSVKVTVYEKALAGYVEYLGHYMYFDKDGIVVEGSSQATPGIPFVTGLSYDHVVLYEKLPVENEAVFMQILTITQLLNKYDIATDRIYFDLNGNITLYFGDARVYLGTDKYIDEKINEMHLLLPKLEGYSGELNMESYTGDSSVFSFSKDKEENSTDIADEDSLEGLDEIDESDAESTE